jgi:hypothetical protein
MRFNLSSVDTEWESIKKPILPFDTEWESIKKPILPFDTEWESIKNLSSPLI